MSEMSLRVVHFEIPADNPERAAKFYRELFGWKIQKWEGPMDYWMVETGPRDQAGGINGGLVKKMGPGPGGYVNSVDVPSVDEYLAKATALGAEVAMPKMPIPGVGYIAYCKDTEGSVFGLFQSDASAK
ncbi:MAG TPA: VOC family protein [Isosphaeraceae bacterium]|jgi:hypothetical protein|nr:VOC family protein [Isosphaeraceae bacterium]